MTQTSLQTLEKDMDTLSVLQNMLDMQLPLKTHTDTHKVIYRSAVRLDESLDRNLRAEMGRNKTRIPSDSFSPDPNDDNISVSDNHGKDIG